MNTNYVQCEGLNKNASRCNINSLYTVNGNDIVFRMCKRHLYQACNTCILQNVPYRITNVKSNTPYLGNINNLEIIQQNNTPPHVQQQIPQQEQPVQQQEEPIPPPPPIPQNLMDPIQDGETRDCSICMTEPGTIICSTKRHTLCMECFENYAIAECESEYFNGNLYCCCKRINGCDSESFNKVFIIQTISDNAAGRYINACEKYVEKTTIEHQKKEHEARLQKELQLSIFDKARKDLLENVLLTRCPNKLCRQVIYDFDGCFALRCNSCQQELCGKCFTSCHTPLPNGHQHVLTGCPLTNDKQLFGNLPYHKKVRALYFNKAYTSWKIQQPANVIEFIKNNCARELKDLGVKP